MLSFGPAQELLDDSGSATGNAPWANGDANAAAEVFIEERYAFIEVDIPLCLAPHHHFVR